MRTLTGHEAGSEMKNICFLTLHSSLEFVISVASVNMMAHHQTSAAMKGTT
jgi:hypothetical protein